MSTQSLPNDHTRSVDAVDWANLPRPSPHAELRWLQRAHDFDRSLTEAWVEGYPVGGVSFGGSARLHPPTGTILATSGGVIATVLDAELQEYTSDHLVDCPECGLEYQRRPGVRVCPWCEPPSEGES